MPTIIRDAEGTAHRITRSGNFPESDCGTVFNGGKRTCTDSKKLSQKCRDCDWA